MGWTSCIFHPWCERHDFVPVERDFETVLARYHLTYRTPIGRLQPNPNVWHQRGDCQKYERHIMEDHLDFNGAHFDGNCALESVDKVLKRERKSVISHVHIPWYHPKKSWIGKIAKHGNAHHNSLRISSHKPSWWTNYCNNKESINIDRDSFIDAKLSVNYCTE